MNEIATKKSRALLEVGQTTYKKIRTGEIVDPELIELTTKLVGLDHQLYKASQKVHELNSLGQDDQSIICPSCQTANDQGAKFCGGCGEQVEVAAALESAEGEPCVNCEEDVPAEANFCPCCGTKVAS
nr:zinc ribbon domain-containing protein [Bacillus suaedae]